MIALLDCNNFYVSCERLFNPRLIGEPVVTRRPKSELSESIWFTGIGKDEDHIFELSIEKLIAKGETIDCEFKSLIRKFSKTCA